MLSFQGTSFEVPSPTMMGRLTTGTPKSAGELPEEHPAGWGHVEILLICYRSVSEHLEAHFQATSSPQRPVGAASGGHREDTRTHLRCVRPQGLPEGLSPHRPRGPRPLPAATPAGLGARGSADSSAGAGHRAQPEPGPVRWRHPPGRRQILQRRER